MQFFRCPTVKSGRTGSKGERCTIQAMPFAGRFGAVVEHVTQVRAALTAAGLHATQTCVNTQGGYVTSCDDNAI